MRWAKFAIAGAVAWIVFATGVAQSNQFVTDFAQYGPEGVWNNFCEIDRMTDVKACRLYIYRLYDNGRDKEFVSVSVVSMENDISLILTASEGFVENCAVRVDKQPKIDSRTASINVCVFSGQAGRQLLEEFKTGQTLLVRANFLKRDRRDMDFTLSGFSRNLDEMQRNLLQ